MLKHVTDWVDICTYYCGYVYRPACTAHVWESWIPTQHKATHIWGKVVTGFVISNEKEPNEEARPHDFRTVNDVYGI